MSLLAGLNNVNKIEETDSVGFQRLASDLYPIGIKMAYLDSNANGTVSVRFEFQVLADATQTPPKTMDMRHVEYISYQGGKFAKDDGSVMRGLKTVNGMAQLLHGKDLFDLERETKMVKVYEDGKEQMREKEVITDFIGQKLTAGIIHAIVDNTPKANNYKPDGTTKEVTEFDKFFDTDTLQTSAEKAKGDTAKFVETWKQKYITGEAFNKAKGVAASGATQGAPAGTSTNNGTAGSLFP